MLVRKAHLWGEHISSLPSSGSSSSPIFKPPSDPHGSVAASVLCIQQAGPGALGSCHFLQKVRFFSPGQHGYLLLQNGNLKCAEIWTFPPEFQDTECLGYGAVLQHAVKSQLESAYSLSILCLPQKCLSRFHFPVSLICVQFVLLTVGHNALDFAKHAR